MLPSRKIKASRGSLGQDRNVPSRTPSEVGGEELDDDKDLMEATPKDDCDFLELLPRELRDKIYGYVLKLDTPVSNNRIKRKCIHCPSLMDTANTSTWESQIREARNLLRTCHQIRDEGRRVFYEVNSWGLHRTTLRDTPPADLSATIDDTRRLFDELHKTKATKHFKHISMQISLSPLAYWDLAIPDSLELNDPVAIHLFRRSQQPSIIASHTLDELAQCKLYKVAVSGLVESSASVFPKLRSMTLKVSLHAKDPVPAALNDPLNRCGITFYVRIKLGRSVVPNSTWLHTILNDPWNVPFSDPRRQMLSPLRELHGVQSVEVERRWTVRYREGRLENGVVAVKAQPLRQLWRFDTVNDMLKSAGPEFKNFLDPALKYLKTRDEDVVEIIENTNADIEHHLIPQSYHVEKSEAVEEVKHILWIGTADRDASIR